MDARNSRATGIGNRRVCSFTLVASGPHDGRREFALDWLDFNLHFNVRLPRHAASGVVGGAFWRANWNDHLDRVSHHH